MLCWEFLRIFYCATEPLCRWSILIQMDDVLTKHAQFYIFYYFYANIFLDSEVIYRSARSSSHNANINEYQWHLLFSIKLFILHNTHVKTLVLLLIVFAFFLSLLFIYFLLYLTVLLLFFWLPQFLKIS